MASSTFPDPSSPSVLLDRFLADRPDGGLQEFDVWAAEQVDLQQSAELTAATRRMLEEWISAAGLLALNKETDQGSAFKAKEREGAREGQAQKALCAGSQVGSFTLSRFIARGGMGQVWEAVDSNLKRTVALKLVLPSRVDRRSMELFAREARAGGRLSHPNLVTTLGYGNDDGLAWIAQELVEGSWTVKDSIDDLRSRDALPKGYYREVAELVASIADGMQAAHDAGVIHRDIKPQNILIGENDRPKVTDFGLARVSDDSFASMTGDIAGTWAYMSPEQVTAKRMGLDHRTDIFSLGVVLYELLTLRRPFDGDTSHETVSMILTEDPPSASTVRSQCPEELAVICAKAMEKSPSRRFSTMGELADDLRRHLRDEPILARPPGVALRALKWSRRHPAISSAGAIAGFALVVVSLLALNLADRTRRLTETSQSLRDLAQVATDRANDSGNDGNDAVRLIDYPGHPALRPKLASVVSASSRLIFALDSTRPIAEGAAILHSILTDGDVVSGWRKTLNAAAAGEKIPILVACAKSDMPKSKNWRRMKIQMRTELERLEKIGGATSASGAGGGNADENKQLGVASSNQDSRLSLATGRGGGLDLDNLGEDIPASLHFLSVGEDMGIDSLEEFVKLGTIPSAGK